MKIIVVENNKEWLNKCVNIFNTLLLKEKLNIKIIPFLNYNNELKKIIHSGEKNIYALDVELDMLNGNDIAHEIRDEDCANDWNSKIIMFSDHDRQKDIFADILDIMVYIPKDSNFDAKLSKALKTAINILANNKFITIREHGQEYNLVINDIVEIIKENRSKYCIIKMRTGERFRYRSSLLKINKQLNFKRINNYTLVNPTQINKIKKNIKNDSYAKKVDFV